MDNTKSFSIDALLAKEPRGRERRSSPVRMTANVSSRSSSTSDSSRMSPRSPDNSMSPPMSAGLGPFIPRPGLLHGQYPGAMLQSNGGMPGLFQSNPFYAYNGHPPGHGFHPMLNGSAFHSPSEQALKIAQMQGLPFEWLARSGLFMPRVLDYAGISSLILVPYQYIL